MHVLYVASRTNIYSSNSEDEESEEDERNRKRLLKAKKLDSDKVRISVPARYSESPLFRKLRLGIGSDAVWNSE